MTDLDFNKHQILLNYSVYFKMEFMKPFNFHENLQNPVTKHYLGDGKAYLQDHQKKCFTKLYFDDYQASNYLKC